jgi:magnesium transporter
MQTIVISQDGRFRADLPPAGIGPALRTPGVLLWLDLDSPDDDDVRLLREEFGFHPLAIEDASRAHERPKVAAYDAAAGRARDPLESAVSPETALTPPVPVPAAEAMRPLVGARPGCGSYYFIVFHAATLDCQTTRIATQGLNLFVGEKFLVTVHQGAMPCVRETIARWQALDSPLEHHVGVLVQALLDAIVDDFFPLMDQVADRVEDLEDTIFVHYDAAAIRAIFALKKDLLGLRRVVAPERDVLNVLLRRQLRVFRPEDVAYLQDVYDHLVRVTDNIDTYRDLLTSALDSYLSLQSNKLNEIVKVLTIASIILMADALVTGFYGQNFAVFPELRWAAGSLWSLGLIAVTTTGLVVYFRRKKWL